MLRAPNSMAYGNILSSPPALLSECSYLPASLIGRNGVGRKRGIFVLVAMAIAEDNSPMTKFVFDDSSQKITEEHIIQRNTL
jgi:hypothetical protein